MSKICKNCGVRHENRAKKCAVCGTAFNDAHIYAKRRRNIILSVVGTILLAAAITFAVYSSTPEAAVRRIMNACERADVDTVVSYYPDFYLESLEPMDALRELADDIACGRQITRIFDDSWDHKYVHGQPAR